MITGEQIRGALAMLKWSQRILHEQTNVPKRTVQRCFESEGVPNTNAQTLEVIQKALEKGSDKGRIEFTNSDAPGIRFHEKAE